MRRVVRGARPTPDGVGGAERGQAGQSVGVAPRGDDLVRAEQLRDAERLDAEVRRSLSAATNELGSSDQRRLQTRLERLLGPPES